MKLSRVCLYLDKSFYHPTFLEARLNGVDIYVHIYIYIFFNYHWAEDSRSWDFGRVYLSLHVRNTYPKSSYLCIYIYICMHRLHRVFVPNVDFVGVHTTTISPCRFHPLHSGEIVSSCISTQLFVVAMCLVFTKISPTCFPNINQNGFLLPIFLGDGQQLKWNP